MKTDIFSLIKKQVLILKDLFPAVSSFPLWLLGPYLLFSNCNGLSNSAKVETPGFEQAIDSLNKLAWDHVDKDLLLFKKYGQEAMEASIADDYLRGRCESFQILGVSYFYAGALDSAQLWYQRALEERFLFGDSTLISGTQNNLAALFEKQGDFAKALLYYKQSLAFLPPDQLLKKAKRQDNIGALYTNIGDYPKALEYIAPAENTFRSALPASETLAKCLLNKANLLDLMADFDSALSLYKEAEQIFIQKENLLFTGKAKNNIGNTCLKIGLLDTAIVYFSEAILTYELGGGYLAQIAGVEQNLGVAYRLKGDFVASFRFSEQSLEKWTRLNNPERVASVLIDLGHTFLAQGQYQAAQNSFQKASNPLPVNAKLQSELFLGLSTALARQQQFDEALRFQIKHNALRDSLERKRIQWQNLTTKYTAAQNTIALLEKDKAIAEERQKKEKILNTALLLGILFLSLLFVFAYRNWLGKKKRLEAEKKALEKHQEVERLLKDQELVSIRNVLDIQDKERKRIAQDLHDRLGSMLSMVKLHFQKTNKDLEDLKASNQEAYDSANKLLDEACNKVREIAHDLNSGIIKNFGLVAAVEDLQSTLINTGEYEVELVTHQLQKRLPQKYEAAVFRIIQEAISNILRHAQANEISIQLLRKGNLLQVTIEDNGKGFDPKILSTSSGIGIKSIKSRLLPFNGELTIDSHRESGTSLFIELPIKQAT